MDKPDPALGNDWRWVMSLFKTNRDRTMWTALELRAEEALKQLVWERQQLLDQIASFE